MFRKEGCYVNDSGNGWTGITVFFNIQLGETLRAFSDLLTEQEAAVWRERYFLTAEYVREYIDKIGATINYPIAGAYAMALAGRLAGPGEREKYLSKARKLAEFSCSHILESGLIFGEGHPCEAVTPKGARAIDIGYNLEESIPALLEYCHLVKDDRTKAVIMHVIETHGKFFLPDGGLDNSFGSRSYKWSYWGSRTSDGIQAAAALADGECPEFRKAAYQNAMLLKRCTRRGLLAGGPMLEEAGGQPCIHHTFCHAKDLAKALMILEEKAPGKGLFKEVTEERCLKKNLWDMEGFGKAFSKKAEYFPDIRTYLVQDGNWRATLTDYDYFYCEAAHATGGAMTLLWHRSLGPVCAGTMNRYYIVEANNMQAVNTQTEICLSPRLEYEEEGTLYRNIHDLTAEFNCRDNGQNPCFCAKGHLRDEQQRGEETFRMQYNISDKGIGFEMECSHDAAFVLPLISGYKDIVTFISGHMALLQKDCGRLRITTDGTIVNMDAGHRIFNPVGGFLAFPLTIRLSAGQKCRVYMKYENR